jgi:hypothetical protein
VLCPRVLGVVAVRGRLGWPRASVLATAGLDTVGHPAPRLRECAELAARLLGAGIAHHDLHESNFVRLANGGCAVLDLQSARRHAGRAPAPRLAARLLAADWPEPERPDAVVEAGLISAGALTSVLRRAQALRRDAVRRRVDRCLLESTEFMVARRTWGRVVQRRELACGGSWRHGGRSLLHLWIGARYLEVSEGERSPLRALCWPRLPFGRWSLYVEADGDGGFAAGQLRWLAAHREFSELRRRRTWPHVSEVEPLPWSGRRRALAT